MTTLRLTKTRHHQRGFSLIELAVVVLIIGILAAMAVPDMMSATLERRAYDDAGQILGLVRTARTRAMGRGAAEMVSLNPPGVQPPGSQITNTRGSYRLLEAVSANPGNTIADPTNRVPRSTCANPTALAWNEGDPNNTFIDGVNMESNVEVDANILSRVVVFDNNGTPSAPTNTIAICFSPLGRAYISNGQGPPSFSATNPFLGALAVDVVRLGLGQTVVAKGSANLGLTRRVLIPSSGNARMLSMMDIPLP